MAGEFDERTVTVSSGTYTLENVTSRYDPPSPSSGYVAIPNCSINYKPPVGTTVLNYKIRTFAQQKDDMDCFIKFMLYVAGNCYFSVIFVNWSSLYYFIIDFRVLNS